MKKILAIALVLILVFAVFSACSSGPAGTYKLVRMSAATINFTPEDYGLDMTFVLKEDGSGSYTSVDNGVTDQGDITWKQDGNQITISVEGGDMVFDLEGKTMTIEKDGTTMVFEKQ